MGRRTCEVVGGAGLLWLAAMLMAVRADDVAVFPMEEVSVFELAGDGDDERSGRELASGETAVCSSVPSEEVKTYPKLKAKEALYGKVTFDRDFLAPESGTDYYFMITSAGEAPSKETAAGKEESLLGALAGALSTESDGPNEPRLRAAIPAFDRLYFDRNRNLDLTDDEPLPLAKDPPAPLRPADHEENSTRIFDYLEIEIDCGGDLGKVTERLLPRLNVFQPAMGYMTFVSTTARKGTIRLGDREYTAVLRQSNTIAGRFDRPFTGLKLTPTGGSPKEDAWAEAPFLGLYRRVDDQLYTISATPSGDRLTVTRYDGPLGSLEVQAGDRDVEKLGVIGAVLSDQMKMLALGEFGMMPRPDVVKPPRHRLPVGKYAPMALMMDVGHLRLTLSVNQYSDDGERLEVFQPEYNLEIREESPCVLQFAKKPRVVFTGPRKGQTVKPGEQVKIEAVLVDPQLGLLINGLEDTTRKAGEMGYTDEEGKQVMVARYESLHPTVVIADASGNEVASGKMPFG